MSLVEISRSLSRTVDALSFSPPVSFVYNPLVYAREPHEAYLERYGAGPKEVVLVGMNPGPFGMAQTGVPFGDVSLVKDWMKVTGAVKKPGREHPKRPILGFECGKNEVSGSRLWGWAKARFGTPEKFFARFFVVNYCPLCFMEESGRNYTPDKLKSNERYALFEACDAALRAVIEVLDPGLCVGVGAFAKQRLDIALHGLATKTGSVLHPSPASPMANRGWAEACERALRALGVSLPNPA
jgi:single-strand selective monofunctional uracil DNA glycosylase